MRYQLLDYLREKEDTNNDAIFYSQPKLVHHLDNSFRNRLTSLYKKELRSNSTILDLMSSWVSHLPKDVKYKKVIAHGLNINELEKNERADRFWVQNLNIKQNLPLEDNSIDYVLVVAGWQYLQYPEKVTSEIRRVLSKNGKLIISFSNRAFWSKTPKIWLENSDKGRIEYITDLVRSYDFKIKDIFEESKNDSNFLSLIGFSRDPFYSIVASTN